MKTALLFNGDHNHRTPIAGLALGIILTLFMGRPMLAQQVSFTEATGSLSTINWGIDNWSHYAFFDMDNDGDLDFLLLGGGDMTDEPTTDLTRLYVNDGQGNFSESPNDSFPFLEWNGSIAIADVNGDGYTDVLMTGSDGNETNYVKLFINNTDGSFTEMTGNSFQGVFAGNAGFADIDDDGDMDLLIAGPLQSYDDYPVSAKLYKNDGTGNFTEASELSFDSFWYPQITFVDIDNDGDKDLFLLPNGKGGGKIQLFKNDGSGNFTKDTDLPFYNTSFRSSALIDLNNDGNEDILVASYYSGSSTTKAYLNDGQGNFSLDTGLEFDFSVRGIYTNDVNQDGAPDIIFLGIKVNSNYSFETKLFLNDGSGNFTENPSAFPALQNGTVYFADFNDDQAQDVFIEGMLWDPAEVHSMGFYMNTTAMGTNTFQKTQIKLYPNPTHGLVSISADGSLNEVSIELYGITGKLLYQTRFSGTQTKLDMSPYANGIYFVKLQSGKTVKTIKVVKE